MYTLDSLLRPIRLPFLWMATDDADSGSSDDASNETDAKSESVADSSADTSIDADDKGNGIDGAPWTKDNFDAERAWRLLQNKDQDIEKVKTTADQRVKNAADEAEKNLAQKIGKALGLVEDEETKPDELIAQLTKERDSKASQLNEYLTKDAIRTAARNSKADEDLLIPVLVGKGALKDLDPSSEDFADQVAAIVVSEVEKNPKLRATQVASATSNGNSASGDRKGQLTRDDLKRMSPQERLKAAKDGRLTDLLK